MIFALPSFLTLFLSSVLCLCIMIQPVFDEVETILQPSVRSSWLRF